MKNDSSTNNHLENQIRKGLSQTKGEPDPDTWAKIAARQRPRNFWLRARHYSRFALPIIALMVIAAGWWYQHSAPTAPENTPPPPVQQPSVPVAVSPAAETPGVAPTLPPSPNKAYPAPASGGLTAKINTVPGAALRFQANSGVDYLSPATGTRVQIPANALVDRRGQPVVGEVELLLREYREIADFLASGIPMHYGDERGNFFFNSAGMFEVRVSQNGEPLALAPGETYDVTFAPTGELTNTNLYYYDEDKDAWEYRPDPAFRNAGNQPAGQPMLVSETDVVRENRSNRKCLPPLPELSSAFQPEDWVKDGIEMGYELATGKAKMPAWFRKQPHLKTEAALNGIERGLVRIVPARDLGELFFAEDLNNVFTELNAFKDCYFIRAGDSMEMRRALDPNIYWERISVKFDMGKCLISLYSDKEGLMQFYATLTPSLGNKHFDATAIMSEYHRQRTERQRNFERLHQRLQRFQFVAPAFQTEDEWCMSPAEWLNYFEEQHPLMTERYAKLIQSGAHIDNAQAAVIWSDWRARARECYLARTDGQRGSANPVKSSRANLVYALQLTSFGVYNCDQIFRLGRGSAPEYVYAAYQTTDGQRITASAVSILERNSRLFFTLPSAAKMLRMPGRNLDVVVTDKTGRQYHLSGEQYTRLMEQSGNSSMVITVQDITDKTLSPRDWATYLDL